MVDIFSIDSLLGAVMPFAIPVLFLLIILGIVFALIRSIKFIAAIAILGILLIFLVNTFAPVYTQGNASSLYVQNSNIQLQIPFLTPTQNTTENKTIQVANPSTPSNVVVEGKGNPADVKITSFLFGLRSSNGIFQRSYIRPDEALTVNYYYAGAVAGDTFTISVVRADSDQKIADFSTTSSDSGFVLANFNSPSGKWQAGPYRIDIWYNNVKIKDGTVLCVPEPDS